MVTVHIVELEMMAGDELVEDSGAGEGRTVAAHAHQFVLVRHTACWIRYDDSLTTEKERVDFLACWCHHGRFPEIFGDSRYSYEVVFLYVRDCLVGEIADDL